MVVVVLLPTIYHASIFPFLYEKKILPSNETLGEAKEEGGGVGAGDNSCPTYIFPQD